LPKFIQFKLIFFELILSKFILFELVWLEEKYVPSNPQHPLCVCSCKKSFLDGFLQARSKLADDIIIKNCHEKVQRTVSEVYGQIN
jgi:hypothetical protein